MGFLNSIARIFWGLFDLIATPFRWINDQFRESPRTRAFLYAIPALFAALSGVALVTAAQIGREREMLEYYDNMATAAHNKYLKQLDDLNAVRRVLKTARAPDPWVEAMPAPGQGEGIDRFSEVSLRRKPQLSQVDPSKLPDDQRSIYHAIADSLRDEQTFLLKLITLAPTDQSYRYRYGMTFEVSDEAKQVELMKQLAPEDVPGYADAHFWLSYYYYSVLPQSDAEQRRLRLKSLQHADHCLTLNANRADAQFLRGRSLIQLNRISEAIKSFRILFDSEPEFFEALIELNRMVGADRDNQLIYELAAQRLDGKIREVRGINEEAWTRAVRQRALCLVGKLDYVELEKMIKTERELAKDKASNVAFLNRIHAAGLLAWAENLKKGENWRENLPKILEKLQLSLRLEPADDRTKSQLTLLAMSEPSIREQALAIYDSSKDPDLPGSVLQIMGNAEMLQQNYTQAVSRYEEARRKLPPESNLLNNLAYAYLMSDSKNAERALLLVDQAIDLHGKIRGNDLKAMASFWHTKGSTLMVLGRNGEAAACFESALQQRPDDQGIIEYLVKCYRTEDPRQAEVFQKRLDELRAKPSDSAPK